MRPMKCIKIFLFTFLTVGIAISCTEDFLDQPAIASYDESTLANKKEVYSLLVGVYSQLNGTQDGFSGMVSTVHAPLLGSIRGGEALLGTDSGDGNSWEFFPTWTISSTTSFTSEVFHFYYNAVSMANQLISIVPQVSDMEEDEKTQILAEARFLRAHYYFFMKRIWGNIPWVDETNGLDVKVPNTDENGNYVNIWPNIEADMQFAIDNLPDVQTEVARANSWAAKAYMVKIRMEQKKYDDTTYNLVMDVINNGVTSSGEKYGLMPHYHDNWDPEQENNAESVFAVQISVNAESPSGFIFLDPDQGMLNPASIWMGTQTPGSPGYGRGWGYFAPSQWFVDKFRVNESGLPYLDYYETNSEPVKNDYGLLSSEPFEPETKPLDPRLDWNVGRRGIPYLDWGIMPGPDWMRDATGLYNGPYIQKKWMYYKALEGVHNQVGWAYNSINLHVIRYADVLLWAAELEARVKNNMQAAADFVNQVRARMQDETGWVMTADGSEPAANYKIGLYPAFASQTDALNAILFERSLELGIEGSRFYDVVRFGTEYIQKELQDYATFQGKYTAYMKDASFDVGTDELLPFSQTAIINSQVDGVPTLKQNPGYTN